MSYWALPITGFFLIAICMSLLWLYQKSKDQPSIVDPAWSFGIFVLCLFYSYFLEGNIKRKVMVIIIIGLWSLRLTTHLIKRIKSLPEDSRYIALREKWGKKAQRNFFWFFQLQAFWAVIFSVPPMIAITNTTHFQVYDIFGILIWSIALIGESIADKQLSRFRTNPNNKGKVCQIGLWRYSRHPNYFFEWLHWWCYVMFAVNTPTWWLTLIGPIVMLYFLLKVTGIPPTEAQSLQSKGDAYRAYQKTTSKFFPWFPKER